MRARNRIGRATSRRKINLLKLSFFELPLRFRKKYGLSVIEQKWDNLIIILDACRYDYFKIQCKIPGLLYKVISLGTSTIEWLMRNFPGKYPNIVYVSGHIYLTNKSPLFFEFKGENHFDNIINVWRDNWDNKVGSVPRARARPGNPHLSHTNDERISIEDYMTSIIILKDSLLYLEYLHNKNQ